MSGHRESINPRKTLLKEEVQRDATAIHALATDEAKETGLLAPTRDQLDNASRYFYYLKEKDPNFVDRIVEETNAIEDIKNEAGTELYELWGKTRLKVIQRMNKEFMQATEEMKTVTMSAQKDHKGLLTKDGKRNVEARISRITRNLNILIIIHMQMEDEIKKAFLGKDALFDKFTAFQKTQSLSIPEAVAGHYALM